MKQARKISAKQNVEAIACLLTEEDVGSSLSEIISQMDRFFFLAICISLWYISERETTRYDV